MDRIYVFLIRNDVWIYILCGLGLIWYLSEFWRSRRLLRSAMFGLEKERGQRIQRRALSFIVFFLAIIILVVYVNSSIAPSLPPELLKPPTPTPNIFATPLSSPTPIGPSQATATLAIAPTVTLPNPGNAGPVPTLPESDTGNIQPPNGTEEAPTVPLAGCSADVNIISPVSGIPVSGIITFFGTVENDDFGSYELEANGPQTGGAWLSILAEDGSEPVSDGVLGTTNLSNWLPGEYTIRLTLYGAGGAPLNQCPIEIQLQPATS